MKKFLMFLIIISTASVYFLTAEENPKKVSAPLPPMEKQDYSPETNNITDDEIYIRVLMCGSNTVETMTLEEYVAGVLWGEMTYSYGLEALKAQAVTSRTYALRKILNAKEDAEYDVCDSSFCCQAYISHDDAVEAWSSDWVNYIEPTMNKAVKETEGMILTYEGTAINAMCHASSVGKTESSENVFGNYVPYLISVENVDESSMDKYNTEVSVPAREFAEKLDIENVTGIDTVLNDSGRVDYMTVYTTNGSKNISGREARTIFKLRSTAFKVKTDGKAVIFNVQGFGHGIGLSQYGAKIMGEAGKSYTDILNHYFPNTNLEKISK